jgi:hypothetical protein
VEAPLSVSNSPTPPVATPITSKNPGSSKRPGSGLAKRWGPTTAANPPRLTARHGSEKIFHGLSEIPPQRAAHQGHDATGGAPPLSGEEPPLASWGQVESIFCHFTGPIARRTWHSRALPPSWHTKRSIGLQAVLTPRLGTVQKHSGTLGRRRPTWPGKGVLPHLHNSTEVCVGVHPTVRLSSPYHGPAVLADGWRSTTDADGRRALSDAAAPRY